MGDASDPQSNPLSWAWKLFDHEANEGTRDTLPPRSEREALGLGDFAHVTLVSPSMAQGLGENVWVRVLKRGQLGGLVTYSGELDTTPKLVSGLKAGSAITFGPEHVKEIESTIRKPGTTSSGGGGGVLLLLAALAFGGRKGRR